MFRIKNLQSESLDQLLDTLWDAIQVDYPDELDRSDECQDGFYYYDITATLDGEEIFTAEDCWVLAGWLPRGASQDLDGSGLTLWGDAQPGGWSQCSTDSTDDGHRPFAEALVEWTRDNLESDDEEFELDDEVLEYWADQCIRRMACPTVLEPSPEEVFAVVEDDYPILSDGDSVLVAIGTYSGTPMVASRTEYRYHPDYEDVRRVCDRSYHHYIQNPGKDYIEKLLEKVANY